MSQIRFFTDEDVYAAVAPALRQAGFDAVSTPELNRRSETDESQVTYAASEGLTMITFNVAHFTALHFSWQQQSLSHAGIIVSSQRSIGDLLRRLLHIANTLDAAEMTNRLEFLSDW